MGVGAAWVVMATVDCSSGEDELMTVGIATVVFDELSAGKNGFKRIILFGRPGAGGVPQVGLR